MKNIKIKIKTFYGKVLFKYESENNTIKKTLIEATERGADLRGAYLRGADLTGADLTGADLTGADLTGADLTGADLRGADLRGADLTGADLTVADLTGADLRGAYLTGADLRGADLRGADLRGADLRKIKHLYQIIPEEGSFIAWKKLANGCLAKLEIPSRSARVCNLINRKCRAKFVKTLKIWDKNGKEIKEMYGSYDKNTVYKVNRLTRDNSLDKDMKKDCTNGIHFFISKQEAIDWI